MASTDKQKRFCNEKAYAAYAYKTRDKSKDKEKAVKKRVMKAFKTLLEKNYLYPDFTARKLLKAWRDR